MAQLPRLDSPTSPRIVGGLLSASVHLGLAAIIILSGGHYDGVENSATPFMQLVMIEAPEADRREGVDAPQLEPAVPAIDAAAFVPLPLPVPGDDRKAVARQGDRQQQVSAVPTETSDRNQSVAPVTPEPNLAAATATFDAIEAPPTLDLSDEAQAALLQRLMLSAEALTTTSRTEVTWQDDAQQYTAVLTLERAKEGSALDRVSAEVSAQDHGRQLITHVKLNRLAFSSFAQMVDRWDPTVQLHDDEIDGRLHVNSRFNLMYDRRTAPKLLGKVTTSARSFNTQAQGSRRERDIFRGGVETRAGRIALPEHIQPLAGAPPAENARIHECVNDTRIRFFGDGSYLWRDLDKQTSEYRTQSAAQPVYFVAARGATLYVQGVVAGSVLIYSPDRIIIEGDLTYAHDPRAVADAHDYVGLVSDRYIQIARPHVTGRGDLEIHAAIFARRSFVVTDIDQPRAGTLRIYGSLTAGTLSATEPRYATKIEYDRRFEQRRPPGFPATDRFAIEDWDGVWRQAPRRVAEVAPVEEPSSAEARAQH